MTVLVEKDVIVAVPQPTVPATGVPPRIGLVEISQTSAIPGPVGPPGPGVVISDAPPANPVEGDLWWESDSARLYTWYNDGSSAQWVQVVAPTTAVAVGADSPVTATGATEPRPLPDHLADDIYVEDFGAVGDGVTDDSAAFTAAFASGVTRMKPRKYYAVKDLVLSYTLIMNQSILQPVAGAKWIIRLTGYEPRLMGGRIYDSDGIVVRSTTLAANVVAAATGFTVASATGLEVGMLATVYMNNDRWHISPITAIAGTTITTAANFEAAATSGAAVACSWGMVNVRGAYRSVLRDLIIANASFGVVIDADPAANLPNSNYRGTMDNVHVDGCEHVGMFVGRESADSNYTNSQCRGAHSAVANAVGDGVTSAFTLTAPAWRLADTIVKVNGVTKTRVTHWNYLSTSQIQFTAGNIPTAGQAIAITTFPHGKGGLVIDGSGHSGLYGGDVFNNMQCLEWRRGVIVRRKDNTMFDQLISDSINGESLFIDTLSHVVFAGTSIGYANTPLMAVGSCANVRFNGPLKTTFATVSDMVSGAVGPYAVDVAAGTTIHINTTGWLGSSDKSRNTAGTYTWWGSTLWQLTDIGTIPPGVTSYWGVTGQSATAGRNYWLAERANRRIVRMYIAVNVSPGAGKSFTFTATVNGVDTSIVGVVSDSSFGVDVMCDLLLADHDRVQVKVVATAGTGAAALRGYLELI